jgi:hypothetical protein
LQSGDQDGAWSLVFAAFGDLFKGASIRSDY